MEPNLWFFVGLMWACSWHSSKIFVGLNPHFLYTMNKIFLWNLIKYIWGALSSNFCKTWTISWNSRKIFVEIQISLESEQNCESWSNMIEELDQTFSLERGQTILCNWITLICGDLWSIIYDFCGIQVNMFMELKQKFCGTHFFLTWTKTLWNLTNHVL